LQFAEVGAIFFAVHTAQEVIMSENVLHLDEANFRSEVENHQGLVLVDFWAPWCGPCRMIGPIMEDLAKEYKGQVKVAKVNIDDNNNLAMRFSIRSIPTVLLLSNGTVKESIVGAVPKQKFVDAIKRAQA
jgi:thioredoxin